MESNNSSTAQLQAPARNLEPGSVPGPGLANMFNDLVNHYDFVNHLLSLNRDQVWRRALVNRLDLWPPEARILDLATGTGDQLTALKKAAPNRRLTGLDFSEDMLALARAKLAGSPGPPPELLLGDALELPYPEASFEAVTISFGLRNIAERARLYDQALRVLKPGGQFLILEMYFARDTAWSPLYRFYLNRILPLVGTMISGRKSAYRYLAESIMKFPQPLEIKAELAMAGYSEIGHKSYSFNTAMLVWGRKPLSLETP